MSMKEGEPFCHILKQANHILFVASCFVTFKPRP